MESTRFEGANSLFIVDRVGNDGPAAFGKLSLLKSLQDRGVSVRSSGFWDHSRSLPNTSGTASPVIIIGETDDPLIRRLLEESGVQLTGGAEGVISKWCRLSAGASALVLAGTDDTGTMYCLLEAAARVRSGGLESFGGHPDTVEYPDLSVRGVYRFIMGRLDNEWYESIDFWKYYYGRLAAARFNRFVLVMGFDTGYFSPPYPFFVHSDKYPDVRAAGLTTDEISSNLRHLNRIIDLAHDHGIEFILGSWQQTPWIKEEGLLVDKLPDGDDALADYCVEGVKSLLRETPALDGIHFRVNHEAGVGDQTSNEVFWRRMVAAVAEVRPDIKLELRAKGLTDNMIGDALDTGLKLSVPTKYWCEHAGLPHHLTQMRSEELTQLANFNHSRRYSYADMLKHPRPYDLIYRLWNNGTTSILLWSDPDYVRRFMASCNLGSAAGFEVSAPLALQWGHSALQKDRWSVIADPALRSGTWEDERYWLFYELFGRIGYNNSLSSSVSDRAILKHYPETALPALRTAHASSGKILPLITAFHMPVHPQLAYWPEVSTGGALFAENSHRNYRYMKVAVSYGSSEPSDPGLFYAIDRWVDDLSSNSVLPKYSPLQVGEWLRSLSRTTWEAVERLDSIEGVQNNPEFAAARVDFLMLADIALYHVHKIHAAVHLCRFKQLQENGELKLAQQYMGRALGVWRRLAERATGVYHDELVFQAGGMTGGRMGHWNDWIPEVEADLAQLDSILKSKDIEPLPKGSLDADDLVLREPRLGSNSAFVPKHGAAGRAIDVELRFDRALSDGTSWTLLYRHANQLEGAFIVQTMEDTADGVRGTVPADYVVADWDILLYFAAVSVEGHTKMIPGLYSSEEPMPYFVVAIS